MKRGVDNKNERRKTGSRMTATSDALAAWRARWELKTERIAVTAGVSRTTVYNWEEGHGEPSLAQLRALEELQPGLMALLGLADTGPDQKAAG